ncbi:hypothetical protein PspLS_02410 [Pyricularia sp. CBS 133598]|nr:hypothetical protein PspLS_02410 [Pyricularia sp. CBS 133598]
MLAAQDPHSRDFRVPDFIQRILRQVAEHMPTRPFVDRLDEVSACSAAAESPLELASSVSLTTNDKRPNNKRPYHHPNLNEIDNVSSGGCHMRLDEKVHEVNEDSRLYIQSHLETDENFRWLPQSVGSIISDSLIGKSSGNFRLIKCQIDEAAGPRTVRAVKMSLNALPQGLYETDDRILSDFSAQHEGPLHHKTFTFLAFFLYPLRAPEPWEAVAIEAGSARVDDRNRLRSPEDIRPGERSLLSTAADGHVRFNHLSVRDYVLLDVLWSRGAGSKAGQFALEKAAGHAEMAPDCLKCLCFDELAKGPAETSEEYLARREALPMLKHAAMA